MLEPAFARLQACGCHTAIVTHGGPRRRPADDGQPGEFVLIQQHALTPGHPARRRVAGAGFALRLAETGKFVPVHGDIWTAVRAHLDGRASATGVGSVIAFFAPRTGLPLPRCRDGVLAA